MNVSNRQALEDRNLQLEALAAFANLGDSQEDWEKLSLMHPEIFGEHWLLTASEENALGLFDGDPSHVCPLSSEDAKAFLPRRLRSRDCLRSVWSGNDREGRNLRILYGFDLMDDEVTMFGFPTPKPLAPGEPIVDGITGEISWRFPSEFQRTLYELMKNRRRAKICPQCGRYFIANKNAQAYCSTGCAGNSKNARSLDYFNREGRAKRTLRREQEKKNDL
jgi:ribosomal protein L37AE/L43A